MEKTKITHPFVIVNIQDQNPSHGRLTLGNALHFDKHFYGGGGWRLAEGLEIELYYMGHTSIPKLPET